MTPILNRFAAQLAELEGRSRRFKYEAVPMPAAIIRAIQPAVGDMTIYDDGDGLTIDIGRKHHTHFYGSSYGGYSEAKQREFAARDAANWVNDVLSDRVCITVEFLGTRRIGSSSFYIRLESSASSITRGFGAGSPTEARRSERYLWSGPIP